MAEPWPPTTTLTAAQIDKLRKCPDFANVFNLITRGWGPDNAGQPIGMGIDDHINTVWWIWTNWSGYAPAFHKDYKDYADYVARKCSGASADTGSGGDTGGTGDGSGSGDSKVPKTGNATVDKALAWVTDNPIPAAVIGFTVYSILLRKR